MQANCEQRIDHVLEQHIPPKLPPSPAQSLLRVERRSEMRYVHSCPARVWGVDIHDEPFGLDCFLDNVSRFGLYLKMPRQMKSHSGISLVVNLLRGPQEGSTAAIKGQVLRDELGTDGKRGVAVMITEFGFL